jgi:S1-C subfamily serine protease
LLLLGIVLGAVAFWAGGQFLSHLRKDESLHNPDAKERVALPGGPLDADEQEAVNLFKNVKPSVVNVDLVQQTRVGWDERPAERQTSAASGFIWDDAGHIVTNYHAIADLENRPNLVVRIVMADRSAYDAVVVGVAPDYDLAVLDFSPSNRPPADKIKKIELGKSSDLQVGERVYAIGNPFGLSLTMTRGIISALDRVIDSPANTPIQGIIQVDAAINPGNSGGPLLNKSGHMIGVNTAIASAGGNSGSIGIGFAIPSDTVNQVVTQIIRTGRVLRPDLGIKLYNQRKLRQARYDHGVMIEQTVPNGPAAQAGLHGIRRNPSSGAVEPGDLIIGMNGQPIDSVDDYQRVLATLHPGEQIVLKIVRKDVEKDVTVTVGGS